MSPGRACSPALSSNTETTMWCCFIAEETCLHGERRNGSEDGDAFGASPDVAESAFLPSDLVSPVVHLPCVASLVERIRTRAVRRLQALIRTSISRAAFGSRSRSRPLA